MIARNASINLIGHLAPLVAALFFMPALVARLDADRFGFLALAWVLIAYFSLFDLGFARSLSRLIAERSATSPPAWLAELSRTALTLTLALGLVAGFVLFATADFLCLRVLRLPPALRTEAADALRVLACGVPLVTLTGVLRGLLEAGYRFGWVNAIRIPNGVLLFAAPLVATVWTGGLVALAWALFAVRAGAFLAHFMVCIRFYPSLITLGRPRMFAVKEIFGYGAWLTVSNVVGPLILYLDRFALGTLIAVSAVAYYAMPYEVVTRLWVIPAALAGVLFPVMAGAKPERLSGLYRMGVKAVLISVFPLAFGIIVFAPDWLQLWLGDEYATKGARVAQLLCLGVMVSCLAYIPATLLQARGRADLMAKMHLAELPVFVVLLAVLIPVWGAEGAALATAARCIADAIVVFVMVQSRVPGTRAQFSGAQLGVMVFALIALIGALAPFSLLEKLLYFTGVLGIFAGLAWLVLLDTSERARARHPIELITGEQRR